MTRLRLPLRCHPRSLALDAVFFVWLSYVVVSGHILPAAVVELIQRPPTTTVVSEPLIGPSDAPVFIAEELPEAAGRAVGAYAAL